MSFFEELKRRNVIRIAIAYGVVSWFLLQLADLVLENIAAPVWVMQTLMLLMVIGFPLAILFAWAFERTPEGLKREKDVDRSQSITTQTGRKLDRAIIGVLTIVVGYLLVDKLILNENGSGSISPDSAQTTELSDQEKLNLTPVEVATEAAPSVAVLPFVNMSGDKENEYFSDGLTETLLHMLAQLPDLKVAARTSSFAFKGQNTSVGEIARTLGVAHILEGSVQKSGDRVRITAQLIRAEDGFHVWSQNYTRPLEDIFAIQDEIAEDVAGALDLSLLGGANQAIRGVETTNLTAYESYLKGLEQQAIYSYGSLSIAENHFKQALARDPEFTDARLALVRNYLLKNGTGLIKNEEARLLVEPLIERVREQHPDNRLARALEIVTHIQTNLMTISKEEMQPSIAELRNLLPLIPTETIARERVAQVLNFYFKDDQSALEVLEAGLMIDPLDANLHGTIGGIHRDQKRLDKALASYQKAQKLAPDNPNVYSDLAELEEDKNNLVAGLQWRRKATEVDPQDHELAAAIAHILYKLELPEEGDQWYARITALAPGSPVAKHAEIHRYIARKEFQNALDLCRSMITDQVENRRDAFGEALFTYQQLMMDSGKSKEAYDFLVSLKPEITNYGVLPSDFNVMMMQMSSTNLMSGFETFETRKDAWTKIAASWDKAGFPWREPDNRGFLLDKIYTGDVDAAISIDLEHHLSKPLATRLEMHIRKNKAIFAEVYADPRVVIRMAELGKQHEQFREQVRELMLEPEWSQ